MDDVANEIRARGGPPISAAYLSLLRRGKRDNPTKEHIAALAGFFGVAVTYFFDEPTAGALRRRARPAGEPARPMVRRLAVAAQGLSRESLTAVLAIVEQMRRVERLPPLADVAPDDPR